MAHPERTMMCAAIMRLALLLAATLKPSTSVLAQGGDKDVDTKVVSKAFKVEVNGQFLPVKAYSGGSPTSTKGNGTSTYTVPAAARDKEPEFERLAGQAIRGKRGSIRVIEADHVATDCRATWAEQDGRRVLVITCDKRAATRRPR